MAKTLLVIAAISGLLAILIGAFGAHGLKGHIATDLIAVFQTGVQYHFYHALALLFVGILLLQFPQVSLLKWSGWLFVAGMVIFPGSLYVMALTGIKWLGAITPIGASAFIAGWLTMAVAIYNHIGE